MKLPVLFLGLLALGGAAMCGSLVALALAAPPPAPVAAPAPSAPGDGWPFVPLLGMGAVALLLLQRRTEQHDDHAVAMRQAAHPPAPTAHILHWHPPEPARLPAAPIVPDPEPPALPAALPGVTTMAQVRARGWTLAPDCVLHALGPGGQALTSPGKKAMHLLFAAPTGEGKTNLMLLFILQFIRLGYSVYLLDLKFRPYHDTTGIDWARIASHTTPGRAYTDPAEILDFLEWAAMDELERRRKAFNAGVPMAEIGPPIYLFIEEALALAGVDKTRPVMVWIGKIMQLGRDLGIFIAMAVQGALIKQLGGSIADQANTRTRFCGIDADDTTRARLMEVRRLADLPEPGPDFVVTPGVLYLRSDATARRPMIVRVPLVEAADVAWYLPETATKVATQARPPTTDRLQTGYDPATTNVIDLMARVAKSPPPVADVAIVADVDPDAERALDLFLQYKKMARVVKEMYGITSSEGGNYQAKLNEVSAMVADAMEARLA